MKNFLLLNLICFALIVISSCGGSQDEPQSDNSTTTSSDTVENNQLRIEQEEENEEVLEEEIKNTALRGENFELIIEQFEIEEQTDQSNKFNRDTLYITASLGSLFEGKKIRFSSDQISEYFIEQRYETSISIMKEGPHCDLVDWKHYHSDWRPMQKLGKNEFQSILYTEKEKERFPKVSSEEIKQAVLNECGSDWVQLIAKINSPIEYPSSVGVSRYFIKITGVDSISGLKFKKVIVIVNPMGC
jgi:hypothetical protein